MFQENNQFVRIDEIPNYDKEKEENIIDLFHQYFIFNTIKKYYTKNIFPDTLFLNFFNLLDDERIKDEFIQIYTDEKNSLNFKSKFSTFNHKNYETRFEEKIDDNNWKLVQGLGKGETFLLIPPRRLKATDLGDFVRQYNNNKHDWKTICKELFLEIRKSLKKLNIDNKKEYWVYTAGRVEPYLHIRFEPFKTRKYLK